jgi:cystathionine beta-lyase
VRYDFDHVVDRRGTECVKWDTLGERFGRADALPMWVADMDFATLPEVQQAIVDRARHPIYGYTVLPPDYAAVVGGWLERRHGWHPDPDALVHVNGVVRGLAIAVAAFTAPGDSILVLAPTYHPFEAVTSQQGRTLIESPLVWSGGEYTIDFDGIRAILNQTKVAAAIVCSPHNPTGRVWRRDELVTLGTLLLEHGVLVLADEVHSDLIYPEFHHIPFASVSHDFAMRSVTFVAASKTFGLAGLNTSVAVIPSPELRERFSGLQSAVGSGLVNTFGMAAMLAAFRHGDEWVDQLMAYLAVTRDYVLGRFAREIPGIRAVPPQGTYLLWLDCRGLGLADDQLHRFMVEDAGVALSEGSGFGPTGSGFERMNLAMPRELIAKGMDQLADAVRRR